MATDMLLVAGDHRMARDGAQPRPAARDVAPTLDLQAIVARAVIPRLRQAFAPAQASAAPALATPALATPAQAFATPAFVPAHASLIAPAVDAGDVEAFIDQLLRADVDGACDRIDALRSCGPSLGRIYLDLLMPAALRLAGRLADDLCDATEATLAFCNLQIILRRYADLFHGEAGQPPSGLRALLVSPPVGVQAGGGLQVFGLLFAAEFFRREGWDVWTERSLGSDAFKEVVLGQWFDLVEVLATEGCDLDVLASGIRHIRRGAPNPRVGIVACGRLFEDHPEYVGMIGADHSAGDPLASLPRLKHFVSKQVSARPVQRRRLS